MIRHPFVKGLFPARNGYTLFWSPFRPSDWSTRLPKDGIEHGECDARMVRGVHIATMARADLISRVVAQRELHP